MKNPNHKIKPNEMVESSDDLLIKPNEMVESSDDLLIEILLRLSIKSLIRFKSVSKHFLSVINSPHFYRCRNPNPNTAVGLFCFNLKNLDRNCYDYVSLFPHEHKENPTLNFDFSVNPIRTSIVDSCNGLFLCTSNWIGISHDPMKDYVYNSTTNQSYELPEVVHEEGRYHGLIGTALAFDQAKSPHYTVVYVELLYAFSTICYRILLYSSAEPGAWTKAAELHKQRFHLNRGVYCNGSVHWISCYKSENSLRIDINTKKLYEMPSPPLRGQRYPLSFHLSQSCDHLHYIEKDDSEAEFRVYEMKQDYSTWFVKYEVDISSVPDICSLSKGEHYSYIYGVVRTEREENSFLILRISDEAMRYNLVDKTVERIHKSQVSSWGFLYIETLCPV